jgi:hypothetical protein
MRRSWRSRWAESAPARFAKAHGALLARTHALGAHRLAELLEHAQAHRAGALARGDALGTTPLLRLAER